VDLDALPGRRYAAVVQAVDPLVDANGRSIGVRACIDNRHLQLRPGMFARVTAVFGERQGARVIPEEALVPQAGRQFVIRLVDGPDQDTRIAQRVEVKVGVRQPGRVEITEGLQPGDVVVTAGQQRVQRDGMPVRVVDLNRAFPGASSAAAGAGAALPPGTNGPAPAGVAAAPNTGSVIPARVTAPKLDGPNPCLTASAARSGRSAGNAQPSQR
jgi:membrane fusion protein, multidrug efflux system